jgi:Holliday junction resolvase
MSAMQRTKGQVAEREIAALIRELTGWEVRRRVRNHAGDSDLEGIPGWSVEVKRSARPQIAPWWRQTVAQATHALPVLFYRLDGAKWRAVWPVAVLMQEQRAEYWADLEWTATTTVAAWAAVARELMKPSDNEEELQVAPVVNWQAETASG